MKDSFNRYLWISFGVILGAFIIVAIAFYFLIGDITSRSKTISSDRALIAKQNDSLATFAEIKQDSAQAAVYKTAMDKLLPTQNELINFAQWLQSTAGADNITADFSFTANTVPATQNSPGTVGFSLTADGRSNDIVSFLKELELQAPNFLLSFNSFNLTQNGDDTKIVTGGNIFFR